MAKTAAVKMPGTPRPWMNSMMRAMLRTPGLRQVLGRTFAVMTVTGSRSGRRYSTPVQYLRSGGRYVVLSQRTRKWWRNIASRPRVELLIRGSTVHGEATIADPATAHSVLARCLADYPRVAKFYGIETDGPDGIDGEAIDRLGERVVVILIDIAAAGD